MATTITTRSLEVPDAALIYDVCGPLPIADATPPPLLIGQPMDASGFATLASYFPNRTVVTYDPRGPGRSTRSDGTENRPDQQAADLHLLVAALTAASTRVVIAAGIESQGLLTWRASASLAAALGLELTVFPSNYGGLLGPDSGRPGQPEAFAARLREVLAEAA